MLINYTNVLLGYCSYFDSVLPSMGSDTDLCDLAVPVPPAIRDSSDETIWQRWTEANWGTSEGAYNVVLSALGGDDCPFQLQFETAWTPPKESCRKLIIEFLRERSLNVSIWVGMDPAGRGVTVLEESD